MRGAIAAGSEHTARAGVEILRAGGNAVDAAVAACFATAAGEPTLTSLAGGGVMLFHSAEQQRTTVCDFFANAPGLGGQRPDELDFFAVELDFGPTTQRFHIGAASAAVPGVIPGLCTALERWGVLPLAEVVAPACRVLRGGVTLGPPQTVLAGLLEPILLHSEKGRRTFAPTGRLIRTGDHFRLPELAETLEQLAATGWREYYRSVLGPAMVEQFGPGAGGLLSAEDLEAYQVHFRDPLETHYRDTAVLTNPPPAVGGRMIAMMLGLLDRQPLSALDLPTRIHALCRAMRVADEARAAGALEPSDLPRWAARFDDLASGPLEAGPLPPPGPDSTTHISVVDAAGNAATVTFSYGEGNGSLIGDYGIVMNNLMGEEDLFPAGFHSWEPGRRLETMVSPSLVLTPDGSIVVMGTGGANRIRTALVQVISNVVDHGYPVERVVGAGRVHFESGVLNAETFDMADGGDALERLGAPELVRFEEPNLFFGGVHLVRRRGDGTLEGAGDPRRGGVCMVA